MKYIALLRGINVGGNSIIKMSDLRKITEKCGFKDVQTYIQSGNIIFESKEKNAARISSRLEDCFSKNLILNTGIFVRNYEQFKAVISGVPSDWENRSDLRRYIAFVKEPVTPRTVMGEVKPKEGVDFVKAGPGVVYLSTMLSGLTKSGFTRLATASVYKDITIRNYNTVKKLLALMEAA